MTTVIMLAAALNTGGAEVNGDGPGAKQTWLPHNYPPPKKKSFSRLRGRRGFGIQCGVVTLPLREMFCGLRQAAWPGSWTARKRGFAIASHINSTTIQGEL